MMTVQEAFSRADLFGLLVRGGYVEDPQVLFGAIGDEQFDRVPFQIGQFESDNRADEQLRQVYLEGGGGGDVCESYALAAYAMARHTATDAWEKRGRKGYLFLIGDEKNKPRLRAQAVREVFGADLAEDVDITALYREVEQRWHVYYILPNQTSYYDSPEVNRHWRDLLGERLLKLDDPEGVCDLIAVTIGVMEDAIDLNQGLDDLRQIGSTHAGAVGKALATVGAGHAVARGSSALPLDLDGAEDLA